MFFSLVFFFNLVFLSETKDISCFCFSVLPERVFLCIETELACMNLTIKCDLI